VGPVAVHQSAIGEALLGRVNRGQHSGIVGGKEPHQGQGISYKVLAETLRRAERDGLIARSLDPGRVETATSTNSPTSAGLFTDP